MVKTIYIFNRHDEEWDHMNISKDLIKYHLNQNILKKDMRIDETIIQNN